MTHSLPLMSHIAIIGGGIAGLSTAYHLQKEIAERGLPLRYTLLEAGPRLGGKLLTERIDGYTIEAGPDSFITQKPAALKLAAELGLEERLVASRDENKGVYVFQGGRLKSLPDGVMLIVPTKILPFALSPLFSPLGKLRIRAGGGSGGHKGIGSTGEEIGSRDFLRLRVGIDRPRDDFGEPVKAEGAITGYVLRNFSRAEKPIIKQAIATVAEAVTCLLEEGIDAAQNRYNREL